ncbi:gamma interferon inducible lysosomal thiol reductase [Ancylostoma caninum]|uniref:Gamma interferon inducible lysosomal thiol reductase n=1 Tax=Ancylostoma caninum TaxID=29170 RepID=A0A368GF36_ANCCA|nr:gamma interferon inducible lysosomal thiol reductase [Ancylostoma caninum]
MLMNRAAVLLLIVGLTVAGDSNRVSDRSRDYGNKVDIEVFGETKCIHSTMFMRNQLLPAYKLFGPRLRIRYHPFGVPRSTKCKWTGDGYECTCQHGPAECDKNALQACVIEKLPDTEKHIEMVTCIQGNAEFNYSVRKCIDRGPYPRLDSKSLVRCAMSDKGRTLLARHGHAQNRKAPGMSWVPWVMINGVREQEAERHLVRVLCSRYLKPVPSQCAMYGFEPTEEI